MKKYKVYYYTKAYWSCIVEAENSREARDSFSNDLITDIDFICDDIADSEIDYIEEVEEVESK